MFFYSSWDRETGRTRVATHIPSLRLHEINKRFTTERVKKLILQRGYRLLDVDLVEEARKCIGAKYTRGTSLSLAPERFDCSGLMVYIFAKKGVRFPRYAIDQLNYGPGFYISSLKDTLPGDLVFTNGRKGFFWRDPGQRIGHVGLLTGDGTIIHAASTKRGVVEDPLKQFFARRNFVGAKRVFQPGQLNDVVTVEAPFEADIDSSQTLRWKVLSFVRY